MICSLWCFALNCRPITSAPAVLRCAKTVKQTESPEVKIQITKDGPYLASGRLPLSEQRIVTNAEGESLELELFLPGATIQGALHEK